MVGVINDLIGKVTTMSSAVAIGKIGATSADATRRPTPAADDGANCEDFLQAVPQSAKTKSLWGQF